MQPNSLFSLVSKKNKWHVYSLVSTALQYIVSPIVLNITQLTLIILLEGRVFIFPII